MSMSRDARTHAGGEQRWVQGVAFWIADGSRSHISFVAVHPRPSHLLTVLIFLRSSSLRELWMVLQMQRATVRTCCGIIDADARLLGDSESAGLALGNGRSFSTNSAHCTQVLFSTVMLW